MPDVRAGKRCGAAAAEGALNADIWDAALTGRSPTLNGGSQHEADVQAEITECPDLVACHRSAVMENAAAIADIP